MDGPGGSTARTLRRARVQHAEAATGCGAARHRRAGGRAAASSSASSALGRNGSATARPPSSGERGLERAVDLGDEHGVRRRRRARAARRRGGRRRACRDGRARGRRRRGAPDDDVVRLRACAGTGVLRALAARRVVAAATRSVKVGGETGCEKGMHAVLRRNCRSHYDSYYITFYTRLVVMSKPAPDDLALIEDFVNTFDLEDGEEELAVSRRAVRLADRARARRARRGVRPRRPRARDRASARRCARCCSPTTAASSTRGARHAERRRRPRAAHGRARRARPRRASSRGPAGIDRVARPPARDRRPRPGRRHAGSA